jgi:demethylmenaquinone methyltransferase/2-methoxy-6-polyprenyl-1,4-benzoquinol methylase
MSAAADPSTATDGATRRLSLAKYRKRAASYDSSCGPTWAIRERTISALNLRSGQRVLDVACGTGLSLALLRERVGDDGHVVGFDHSAEMLERAQARLASAGWCNVTVLQSAAQEVTLAEPVDALLFHYTHDILRSPRALARILACARPGARVAIAGIKYFPRWLAPLNAWVFFKNYGYNGAPGGLRTPWDRIAPRLADWQFVPTQFGMGYIASGRLIAAAAQAAPSHQSSVHGGAPLPALAHAARIPTPER